MNNWASCGAQTRVVEGFLGERKACVEPICQTSVRHHDDPARQDTFSILRLLLLVNILKTIAEIALLALVGQWLLGLLAGARRDSNFFYRVLDVMTRPFVRLARLLSPPVVLDRHVPLVAFLLLAFGWLAVTIMKINICLEIGVAQCK